MFNNVNNIYICSFHIFTFQRFPDSLNSSRNLIIQESITTPNMEIKCLIISYYEMFLIIDLEYIQQKQMNKIASNSVLASLKPTNNLPHFLKSKVAQNDFNRVKQSPRKNSLGRQFQQLDFMDLQVLRVFKQRAQLKIQNTPIVLFEQSASQPPMVKVQIANGYLIEHLTNQDHHTKLQKVFKAVTALCRITEIYGYFYCDKFMLKVNEQNEPVVWMHQNSKMCEPEFPIHKSSVSELVFVKRVVRTLGELVNFPKNPELETKKHLLEYLQNQIKLCRRQQQKLQVENKKEKILVKQPNTWNLDHFDTIQSKIKITKIEYKNTLKVITPDRFQRSKRDVSCQQINSSGGAIRQAKKQCLQLSNQKPRHKTTLFNQRSNTKNIEKNDSTITLYDLQRKTNKVINMKRSNVLKKESYKSEGMCQGDISQQKLDQNTNFNYYNINPQNLNKIKLTTLKKPESLNRNQASQKKSGSKNDNLSQSSLSDNQYCFNFKQPVAMPVNSERQRKVRKQSEDIQTLSYWLKGQKKVKPEEKVFQTSTFSTQVTINSMKYLSQMSQEKNIDPRQQLIRNQNQTQVKQKGSGVLCQVIIEQSYKINQQDIQSEADKLFSPQKDSSYEDSPKLKGVRQSKLFKELQLLFVPASNTQPIQQVNQNQIFTQFKDILD